MKENLPKGWVKTKIELICDLIGGGTPSRKNLEYFKDGQIIWLTPTEINKEKILKINSSKENITELGLTKSSAKLIPRNAVLLTSRASIGYVAIAETTVTTNQGFASFICSKIIHNYFLAYWLKSNKNVLEENATGTTFKEIPKSVIKKLSIEIPPFSEQRRIVSKIESIFTQIDAAKVQLEKLALQTKSTSGSLSALKSSVLKQAFEGKLVPQDPDDEPAEILLKKIHGDSKELKFKKDNLPKGWIRTKIGHMIEPSKERFDPTSNTNRIFLGLEHVESNTGKIIGRGDSKELTSTKTIFKSGDILYGRLRPYLNKVCIPIFDGVCSTDILVFQNITNFSNMFISLFLRTNNFVTYANANMTGVQHPRINFKKISEFLIPLPPLNEQKRIVSKIESIFDRIDAKQQEITILESKLKNIPDSINAIKSSILKQAFEGKLVPQDPNDEPASILLEKIKSQKCRS